MFTGFTDDTIQFFLDLKFHNYTEWFHQNHDRYAESVQKPFYAFIEDLSPLMKEADPLMEIRPYKCLSHIHRDTRFSRDKSPYRDHLWLLFRRAAEPRDKSLFFFMEFGPGRLDWGMGFWGENREAMDKCSAEAGDEWDDEEFYWKADEMRKVFPELKFEKISFCAGVISIQN